MLSRFLDAEHFVDDHAHATGEIIDAHGTANDEWLIVDHDGALFVEDFVVDHCFDSRRAVVKRDDAHTTAFGVAHALLDQDARHQHRLIFRLHIDQSGFYKLA